MEYAVSNSTRMRIQAADRKDEQWQRRQAIMRVFTPSVEAQTYAYNQYGRNLDPETNTYNNVTTFHNGYSVSAGITLFDGFQSVNNMRMATTAAKMGLSKEQQTQDEICLATMEAYYNVIYYTELESVLKGQVETAQTARDKAVRQEELGQKGHADVLQMESELAQKQYQLITAGNQKNDAMITLKDVMFWPIEDELSIEIEVSEPVLILAQASELSSTAKAFLPDAEIALMNVRQAKLDLKSARGAYSPTLGLYGGWSTTYYTYPGRADYTP
ncbi:MAG: TolC family protein, partial [Prevotellaceae bacterium]|nr:TolC family protein [Prevotellaceae bacterium]